jgi:hypothetical protein
MVLELGATQTQIQRILQSKAFRTSEVQRNLLAYLAEKALSGTSDSLKEYTVGLDVFGKPASYDPRQESTVRMHVGRLRQKLAEFYRTEGIDDPIIVDLPKGGFKVTFEPRAEAPQAEPLAAPLEPISRASLYVREIVLVTALLVAVACAFYYAAKFRRAEQTVVRTPAATGWTPELQQLWAPILNSSRPLMICLSTPSPDVTGVGAAHGAFWANGNRTSNRPPAINSPCRSWPWGTWSFSDRRRAAARRGPSQATGKSCSSPTESET